MKTIPMRVEGGQRVVASEPLDCADRLAIACAELDAACKRFQDELDRQQKRADARQAQLHAECDALQKVINRVTTEGA